MLVGLSNELGLLSEEYDAAQDRMAGNFPQAFSHLALVRAADALHGVDRLSLAAEVQALEVQTAGSPARRHRGCPGIHHAGSHAGSHAGCRR